MATSVTINPKVMSHGFPLLITTYNYILLLHETKNSSLILHMT